MQNRIAISDWLLANKISVETHFRANEQKVWLLFQNDDDAAAFVESFEGL
ncbi:hypothetical protein [Burkholderia vietnamiensis]|nr:hypothetical protein [Burkholderia vietnamiensis]